jgi:hypothetical protein
MGGVANGISGGLGFGSLGGRRIGGTSVGVVGGVSACSVVNVRGVAVGGGGGVCVSSIAARQRIGFVGREGAGGVSAEGRLGSPRIEGGRQRCGGITGEASKREEHGIDDAEAGELDGEIVRVALPGTAAAGFVHDRGGSSRVGGEGWDRTDCERKGKGRSATAGTGRLTRATQSRTAFDGRGRCGAGGRLEVGVNCRAEVRRERQNGAPGPTTGNQGRRMGAR